MIPIKAPALLLLTVLGVAPGCYRYTPVRAADIGPGTPVRAWITLEEADRLQLSTTLLTDRPVVQGSVVEVSPASLDVLARVQAPDGSLGPSPLRQHFTISTNGLRELEVRSLDRMRTGLGISLGTALVGWVVWMQTHGWFGGNTESAPIDKI